MSAEPDNEYFSDGITEEIIGALSRVEQLRVASRTSAFHFKGLNLPISEIAEKLGVSVILEGSVRLAGQRMRITAQLIQAEEDYHFWSENWDRTLDDIFATQDEVSLLIADKLREQFGHLEIDEQPRPGRANNLAAYEAWLKANQYFNRWTPDDVLRAVELYEEAIELDPNYADAYVGLADASGFLATTGTIPYHEGWARTAEFTEKARLLNPDHPGVYYQLANLSFFLDCDFSKSCEHNLKALELRPNFPLALQFMSFLASVGGRLSEAESYLQKALLIDPFNQETLFFRAFYLYRKEAFTEGYEQAQSCLIEKPDNIPAIVLSMYSALCLGRNDEVIAELTNAPAALEVAGDRLGLHCLALIRGGGDARAALAELVEKSLNPVDYQAHSYRFLAHANQGDADAAFEWLETCLNNRSSILLMTFSGPLAANLRGDARYPVFYRRLYGRDLNAAITRSKKEPLLDETAINKYRALLLRRMEEGEAYLCPSLSLRSLATDVGLHPNQLSWLINEVLDQNFNTLVNGYRVNRFKQLAQDPANGHLSLLGLAFESGFNSKTAFNTAFKKITGTTPRDFLRTSK